MSESAAAICAGVCALVGTFAAAIIWDWIWP